MIELIGIIATGVVVVSFLFTGETKIRVLNILGAIIFVVYGVLINSISVWLLNGVLIVVHCYKLCQNRGRSKCMSKLTTLFGTIFDKISEPADVMPVSKKAYIGDVVSITKEFKFSAGHFVPDHPERCKYIHGHEYTLFVTLTGPIQENGMVMDFKALGDIVNCIIDPYDHGFLNDYYEMPTAEVMACHIRKLVNDKLTEMSDVRCTEVKLYETSKCCASSKGN